MAIKATVYKASVQIADMDRSVYADHTLTLARQPSETDERLMVRLLAFALHVPADDHQGALQVARGMADADEPDLWQKSLTGELLHWIEVGQPDERRLIKACGRAARVTLYVYSQAASIWWAGVQPKLARLSNLAVWQLPAEQSQALARLAARSMTLQVTVQEGQVWVGDAHASVEIHPQPLMTPQP
ncbi:MAG: YaeQ family protein [Rubrivivax sp.]|nr:YaeQ family protein [Rubrivivax sp.]